SMEVRSWDVGGEGDMGLEGMVLKNGLARMIMDIAGKMLSVKHIPGPLGVRGRNSDNALIAKMLGWKPNRPLREGLEATYRWIEAEVCRVEGRNISRAAEQPLTLAQRLH